MLGWMFGQANCGFNDAQFAIVALLLQIIFVLVLGFLISQRLHPFSVTRGSVRKREKADAMRPARQRRVRVQGNNPYTLPVVTENLKEIAGQVHEAKKTMQMSTDGLRPMQETVPSSKIKLQLFPIDDATRVGLEKDGYHPYLELILRARKKISSVLKHIKGKWGSSAIAGGEPVLFPYYTPEKRAASFYWTVNDSEISAGDVYAAIGCPTVFRLRYGWSFNCETTTCREESKLASAASTPFLTNLAEVCPQTEHPQSCIREEMIGIHEEEQKLASTQESGVEIRKAMQVPGDEGILPCQPENHMGPEERGDEAQGQSVALWADSLTTISVGGLLSESSLMAKVGNFESKTNGQSSQPSIISDEERGIEDQRQSAPLWADSLTNISIGGLLSEASLMRKVGDFEAKANGPSSLQSTLITDSLDAFIAANINCSQSLMLPPSEPRSSILDAEDTCHAFSLKRLPSSSSRDLPISSESVLGVCQQENGPKAGKLPKTNKDEETVKSELGTSQDHEHQESAVDLSFGPRVYNDESSLGLAGINWTDTLGPFDLGLPSRKTTNGDSIIHSGLAQ